MTSPKKLNLFEPNLFDFEGIQLIALQKVLSPTYEDFLDRTRRWFSKTYSTPLYQVSKQFDDQYILTCYFEEHFIEMEPQDRRERAEELLMTPEERIKAQEEEEAFDEELLAEMEEEARQGVTRAPKKGKKDEKKALGKVQDHKGSSLKPEPKTKEEKLSAPKEDEFLPEEVIVFEG